MSAAQPALALVLWIGACAVVFGALLVGLVLRFDFAGGGSRRSKPCRAA